MDPLEIGGIAALAGLVVAGAFKLAEKALPKRNGLACKADALAPALQDLRGSIDRLADAVTEHRLATAGQFATLTERTGRLAGDLDAIQFTLAGMSPKRKVAGK